MTGRSGAEDLLADLRAAEVWLWPEDGQLRYRAPRGVLTPERLAALRMHKQEVLDLLATETTTLTADPAGRFDPFPLTDVQAAYLLGRGGAYELGGVGCHGYVEIPVTAPDADRLSAAWRRLVERHDMLRAVVSPDGHQQVLADVPARPIEVLDLRDADPGSTADRLAAVRAELAHRVYDPARWPLHELRLTRTATGDLLHLSIDLLVTDYRGIQLLLDELDRCYTEPSADLPPLSVTFRDYVLAARSRTEPGSPAYDRDRAYWLQRLEDLPAAPELPMLADAHRAPPRFHRHAARIDPPTWAAVREQAGRHGLTASGAVLAAYAESIGRWSRRPRFTLAVTMLDRAPLHPDVDRLVGDFTVVELLAVLADGATCAERALALQRRLWDDLDHRAYSGVEVVRELVRRRGRAASLMPIVFTSTLGADAGAGTGSLFGRDEPGWGLSQTPQVAIDCQVAERAGALLVNWDVRDGVFPAGLVEAAFAAFVRLLEDLARPPAWAAGSPVPLPADQAAVRARVNDTAGPLPSGLLHEAVVERGLAEPDRPAVVDARGTTTYGRLLGGAVAVAATLTAGGVRPGDVVAVVMDKGAEQVVAILGTLLAGAVYLPLDLTQPAARRAALLADAGARHVLTQSWLHLAGLPAGTVVTAVDGLPPAGDLPAPTRGPDDVAYVIYTSGSTGVPKGVTVSSRAALNTIDDIGRRFGIGPADRVLGLAQLGFDLSVWDVFGPLSVGGTLVLPAPDRRSDPRHWAELVDRHAVTVWNSVPAQAQMLLHYLDSERVAVPSLRLALLSGDWIPVTLPGGLRDRVPGLDVVSLGGATEAAIWSIAHPTDEVRPGGTSIPYGTPLTNQTVHVLDARMDDVPDLVPGELHIGGAGLAVGYLGDPDRTTERFVTGPGGRRLYRTGDVGRYRPDGVIEFLGREDAQVKIRGHRIELAEVEAALHTAPGVAAAAAAVTGREPLERRLAAFVEPARTAAAGRAAADVVAPAAAEAAREGGGFDRKAFGELRCRADEVALLAMARALRSLGLFDSVDRRQTLEEVLAVAPPRHHRLLRRWLAALQAEGMLGRDGAAYTGLREAGAAELVEALAAVDALQERTGYGEQLVNYLRASVEQLPELVTGRVDPLAVLFPGAAPTTAQAAYRDNLASRYLNRAVAATVSAVAADLAGGPAAGTPLRVLEIGAGVGGTTADVLAALAGRRVDYLFTDVSEYFLNHARQRFGTVARYALLDLNGDLQAQAVRPNSVDILVCANVLHNARDAGRVLHALAQVLAPGGWLVAIEATAESYPLLVTMELKEGLTDFEDERAHTDQTFLRRDQWARLLAEAGGEPVPELPAPTDPLALAGQSVLGARFKAGRERVDPDAVRAHVASLLPEAMVPATVTVLDRLPLTGNGKVDRAALQPRDLVPAAAPAALGGQPPRDELERRIAAVWAGSLARAEVGRDDDFYALGGDSLLLAQVVGRMREQLPEATAHDWDTVLRQVVRRPTVAGVAELLRAGPAAGPATGPAGLRRSLADLGGTGTDGPTYVLVHEGSGTLAPYRDLASRVTAGGRVLGLEVSDMAEFLAANPDRLVEELGARYTRELLDSGASGFHVVGYCMGGLLATEVARGLTEAGAEVHGLTVVSSYRLPYRVDDELAQEYAVARVLGADPAAVGFPADDAAFARAVEAVLERTPGVLPPGALAALADDPEHAGVGRRFAALAERDLAERRTALAAAVPGQPGEEHVAAVSRVFRQSLAAVARHVPTPYPGDVTFLRQTGRLHFLPRLRADMTAYWQEVCLGRLRVADVPGDHFTCLHEPHVRHVADLLTTRADR